MKKSILFFLFVVLIAGIVGYYFLNNKKTSTTILDMYSNYTIISIPEQTVNVSGLKIVKVMRDDGCIFNATISSKKTIKIGEKVKIKKADFCIGIQNYESHTFLVIE